MTPYGRREAWEDNPAFFALRQAYLGSSVRLGEDQLPDIWRLQVRAYATIDLEPVPDLYVSQQLIGLRLGLRDHLICVLPRPGAQLLGLAPLRFLAP